MDYKIELERVESMMRKGRTFQALIVLMWGLISCMLTLADPSIGVLVACIAIPLSYWVGYTGFADYYEIVYDKNAPRPSKLRRYIGRSVKTGRETLRMLKDYREELLTKVNMGGLKADKGNRDSNSDVTISDVDRGSISEL